MKSQLSIETLTKMIKKNIFCDYGPRISHDAFPLNGATRFLIDLVKIWFLEKTWSCHLFLFYFLKGEKK